jgi:hypothetical protein
MKNIFQQATSRAAWQKVRTNDTMNVEWSLLQK